MTTTATITPTSPRANTATLVPTALWAVCDEVFFGITATRKLSKDDLRALSVRHAPMPLRTMDTWEPWILNLCAAIAPISPPHWMPMARAVEAGLSLEHGARGLRSLFTNEPSESEVVHVRTLGPLAVQALGAALIADGRMDAEDELHRRALIASLGLPEHDQARLRDQAPVLIDEVYIPATVDTKTASAIVRGAFHATLGKGLAHREEQAVIALAARLGLTEDQTVTLRAEARQMVDSAQPFGEACVDAIRFMLADDPQAQRLFGAAAVNLTLPPIHRKAAMLALSSGQAPLLSRRHSLDSDATEAVLALAWVVTLRANPTYMRHLELITRHTRLAVDLGDERGGRTARYVVQENLEMALYPLFTAALS